MDDQIALALVASLQYDLSYEEDYVKDKLDYPDAYDGNLSITEVVSNIALQYSMIYSSVSAGNSIYTLEELRSEAIFQERKTGKYFKVSWTHDSWTDCNLQEASIKFKEVNKTTKEVYE